MELSSLSEHVIDVPYKRGTETLTLRVNIDAFTPQFFREMRSKAEAKVKELEKQIEEAVREELARKPEPKTKKKLTREQQVKQAEAQVKEQARRALNDMENQAKTAEAEREANIEFLIPHVLKGWDATQDGEPVSLDALRDLPPKLVKELFDLCVAASHTVKKKVDEEDEEISDNTLNGSRAPLALAPTG